jgi:hypothetical protein
MHSLIVKKSTTFKQLKEFEKLTGVFMFIDPFGEGVNLRADYGDTIHFENGRVFVEKGKSDER